MSRESRCCIPICTSRNGSGGAGKQGNGMNERKLSKPKAPDPLRRSRKRCLWSDRQQKSGRWVIFHQTPKNTLSFCVSVSLKGNQRLHKMASKNILTSYYVIRNMQKKKKKQQRAGSKNLKSILCQRHQSEGQSSRPERVRVGSSGWSLGLMIRVLFLTFTWLHIRNNDMNLASELVHSMEVCVEASPPSPIQGETATVHKPVKSLVVSSSTTKLYHQTELKPSPKITGLGSLPKICYTKNVYGNRTLSYGHQIPF